MNHKQEEQYVYSVPSSILLCGEYIITEENGAGICLGIEPRSYLHIKKTKVAQSKTSLTIMCTYAARTITFLQANDFDFWNIASKLSIPLYKKYHMYNENVKNSIALFSHSTQQYHIEVHIDTSQLYDKKHKQKLGLGSSASCAILSCAAHMVLCQYDPLQHIDMLHDFATQLHYEWQQKKGSGYELYASLYGGAILLQRQKYVNTTYTPEHKRKPFIHTTVSFPTQFSWVMWNSQNNISSRTALQKYIQWKRQYPTQQQQCTQKIRDTIETYTQCKTHNDYCTWLSTMQKLGLTLGKAIGQSANIALPTTAYVIQAHKACGAGNEQGIGILKETEKANKHDTLKEQTHTVSISEGFRQENI